MKLITTCLRHKEQERNNEFKFCFTKHFNNDLIDKVIIFFQDFEPSMLELDEFSYLRNEKVQIIKSSFPPNFSVMFDYANDNFKGEIVIITNADVYFDETLVRIEEVVFTEDMVLFLTRYTNQEGLCLENNCSFDSYIFRSPIRRFYESEGYESVRVGVMGCDTYLLKRARDVSMTTFNPCHSVKSYHYHKNIHHAGFRYWYDNPHFNVFGEAYCKIEDVK